MLRTKEVLTIFASTQFYFATAGQLWIFKCVRSSTSLGSWYSVCKQTWMKYPTRSLIFKLARTSSFNKTWWGMKTSAQFILLSTFDKRASNNPGEWEVSSSKRSLIPLFWPKIIRCGYNLWSYKVTTQGRMMRTMREFKRGFNLRITY